MRILIFLIFILVCVALAGCTSNNDSAITMLKSEVRDVKYELQSCKNSLDTYRNSGSSSSSTEETVQEPSAPPEPEYETKDVYYLNINNKDIKCLTKNDDSSDIPACGMNFTDCADGYNYRCLTNAKYKTVEEKKLIK
jgi:hypothetical protein